MHGRTVGVLVPCVVAIAGCDPNISGRFAAQSFGERSDVAAPRLTYDTELREACNGGEAPQLSIDLVRRPYLQQLQAASTRVLWAGFDQARHDVEVTLPTGESVVSFESQIDLDARRAQAVQQVTDITGLAAGQIYCYAIRPEGATPARSRIGFRTAPPPGSGAPVSFVALGDSGYGGDDQKAVFAQMQTVPMDFVLHTGDVAYDDGKPEEIEANFFAIYEPMLRSVPFFPVAGNHDYHTDAAAPFLEAFSLPENGGVEGKERWYSFDWGNVHFVALDTERINAAQIRWLEADLAGTTQPWKIVYTHAGPYSSGAHGSNHTFREAFDPILHEHGVQLVLSGHDHHYERSVPIDGITYVVTGAGGRGVRVPGRSSWTAFNHAVLHFVYVTIEGPDLRLYAIDATGQEFDFTHIVNPAP